MALIETSLIWVTYAVALGILLFISGIVVFLYQKPNERAFSVTLVSFISIFALLATVLLIPVDIALTSSTTDRKLGTKKEWATPDVVDDILKQLEVVYYLLFSLDAVLCLLVIPFTYFWYEEYDEVAADEGTQTIAGRLWGAFKYTIAFLLLVIILFLVGFFVPVAKKARDEHKDLDYFKHLLTENHGERALTFSIGILITIGTVLYCLYTAPGLAFLPVILIKSAPSISAPQLAASTSSQLAQNRERQRQLEGRNEGSQSGLSSRDQRELDALHREERTLIRRERLAAENSGQESNWLMKAWLKIEAVFRPLKLLGGVLLLIIVLVIFASMLITCVDKIKNSTCGASCGYLLGKQKIFNPVNWVMRKTSVVFPIDYIIWLFVTLLFFCGSILGLATIGIRFLWITLFKIRKGKTTPNAMLIATLLITLIVLAMTYSLTMIVAPQYATFGPQTYCDRPFSGDSFTTTSSGDYTDITALPNCKNHRNAVKPCSERTDNNSARLVCTPSFISTFLNRISASFPFLGNFNFWAQFVFLGFFILVFIVMLFRTPKLTDEAADDDEEGVGEEDEGRGLLADTGRRFGANWQDITGKAATRGVKRQDYGTTGEEQGEGEGSAAGGVRDEERDSST